MAEKFQNKYRTGSMRLTGWGYRSDAAYFITICTRDKIHFFGKIDNGEIILQETGKIAQKFWYEIPEHFLFVKLGNFVVMPNHVHGVSDPV